MQHLREHCACDASASQAAGHFIKSFRRLHRDTRGSKEFRVASLAATPTRKGIREGYETQSPPDRRRGRLCLQLQYLERPRPPRNQGPVVGVQGDRHEYARMERLTVLVF
jgi:hypothetical protein